MHSVEMCITLLFMIKGMHETHKHWSTVPQVFKTQQDTSVLNSEHEFGVLVDLDE